MRSHGTIKDMTGENKHEGVPQEHEGEKYLELLGLQDLADQQIPNSDKKVRDFLEICGDHALPLLVGLESISRDDPRYEPTRQALRGIISQFVTPEEG